MAPPNQVSLLTWAYAFLTIPVELISLILYIIICVVPAARPIPHWTFGQAIRVRIVKRFLHYWSLLEIPQPISQKPGREKDRFSITRPADLKYYRGPLDDAYIKPSPLGMTWTPSKPSKTELASAHGQRQRQVHKTVVVLYLHGGAFVIGDGRDADAGFAARTLIEPTGSGGGVDYVCAPQYRVASRRGNHFPAALQDALTAYLHLVRDLSVPPSSIILSGDSAGGNLALALVRYIQEYGGADKEDGLDLKMPGGVALWSPWVDVHGALAGDILSMPNYATDYLPEGFGRWGGRAVTDGGRIDALHPYLSPLRHPEKIEVPVFIQSGGAEVLHEDHVRLWEGLRREGTEAVELVVGDYAPHDVLLVGHILGFEGVTREAVGRAGEFFRRHGVM